MPARLYVARFSYLNPAYLRIFCLLCLLATGCLQTIQARTQAHLQCLAQAATSLEEIYCRIKSEGLGASLPVMADFRRNSAAVQALLLKRPAKKLGIALPANLQALQTSLSRLDGHTGRLVTKIPTPRSLPRNDSKANSSDGGLAEVFDLDLSHCSLRSTLIACKHSRYELVNNQLNDQLSSSALGPENKLTIPAWSASSGLTEKDYLTGAYRLYIDKMLQIGLGAATMSFTRFHKIYYDLKSQKTGFTQRFASMFEFLKADKKNLLPPKQLVKTLPPSISNCNYLRSELIVCDDGFHNWLYQK